MDQEQTLLLGFIAGVTILLGLPLGRLRAPAPGLRVFLNATAIGILVFLLWDVLAHAWQPIDAALGALHEGTGTVGPVLGYGTLFLAGLGVGLLSLVGYESWMTRRDTSPPPTTPAVGPGAMASTELTAHRTWSPARRMALLIAVGIGLHNFGEGLAIGGSAAKGEIALATLLVIGFALHNATEGFGIVAPLAADGDRPSWGFLALMGLIGGAPTFLGTAVGHEFTSGPLNIVFLTLAAGSILYVIIQLTGVALRSARKALLYWGVLAGLTAGFVTDMIVTAGGA
ncbi:MAG: zinc transporter, family [Pseudonocardiales bacterium]|jgi:ZIP family zinc transporter|nr:zinc transporter, family [Pseudonocardiales bacterium]